MVNLSCTHEPKNPEPLWTSLVSPIQLALKEILDSFGIRLEVSYHSEVQYKQDKQLHANYV